MRKLLPFIPFLVLAFAPQTCWAVYSDQILIPKEELWQASEKALEPYGVAKKDHDKGQLESRWIEERVVRTSGLFKVITKRTYVMSYRIKIRIAEGQNGMSQVDVEGRFREKPLDALFIASWRPTYPERNIEKEFFQKVLAKLQTERRKAT